LALPKEDTTFPGGLRRPALALQCLAPLAGIRYNLLSSFRESSQEECTMLRIIFWIAAVMLFATANSQMGQWEITAARIIIYLFLLACIGYLTWKNRKLEKRIETLEQQMIQK
jgi:hypothetical protein